MSGATTATYLMVAASAASTLMQMQAADQQARAAQDTAAYNANVSRLQAKDAINRGNIEAERQRVKAQQIAGAQRAAMGASGAQTDSGSFANVLLDTATTGELDAQAIRTNALRQAWGHENQATMDLYEGNARAAAKPSQRWRRCASPPWVSKTESRM